MAAPFRLLPNGARRRLPDGSVRSLGADGLRYTDVEGSTGLGVASGGGATAGVYVQGVSVLMFSLSGNLTQDGFVGTTHLSIAVGGLLSTRSYVMGAANLAFSATAVATATRIIAGTTYFGVTTTGLLVRTNPLRGSLSLSTRVTGRMGFAQLLRGTTRLGFSVSGNLTTAAGGRWRELWLNFYDARQAVLNAIDAHNRTLAKDAGTVANATADALVVTNTNVSAVDGRVTAESNRTTALTTRMTTAEGTLVSQGSAVTTLGTRLTSAEGVNTAQGTAITSLQTEVAGKASSSALSALQSTVTTQGNTITTQGTAITAVSAQAGAAVTATELLDARVDVTEAGVTATKAIHGVYLNVDGHISGTESVNDGVTSTFSIMASIWRVISSGSTGLEWQNGYLRAYSGAIQLILGINFGASSNLCFWYGPNVGANACTKTNGTIWFDNVGSAYFGGSLSAGTFKNATQTTSTSGAAEIINGPFGTNGNPKNVVVSYNFVKLDTANTGTWGAPTGTTSATIAIYRKVGGGAETLVTNFNVTGTVERMNEAGGPSTLSCYMNGSTTFTDTTSGTGDFTYRAVITARSNHTATPSSGTVSMNIAQSLGIISVEQ